MSEFVRLGRGVKAGRSDALLQERANVFTMNERKHN